MSDSFVTARHLSKAFDNRRVLDDLSFTVESGDVVGVLGKNGAGKTTLLELMLGFTPASSGAVEVFNCDSFCMPGTVKARIGFVPQQDELVDSLTARDQLRVIGSFYSNWDVAFIERLSQTWELDLNVRVKSMSVGQRQKLSTVLALGHHPDLLLLDEPVASLDPIARRQFLEQIVDIAADGKRSVVFSSHIVSDIERLASKIWILKNGRLFWQGELDALKESIVRIHMRSASVLPSDFTIPNALSSRRDGVHTSTVVAQWTETMQREIEKQSGAQLEVEPLGLEEIFLELHR